MIWDTLRFKSKIVINGKAYSVSQLTNGALAIGLIKYIEIWDITRLCCLMKLKKHIPENAVCLIALKDNYFPSSSSNAKQIWDSNYQYKGRIEWNRIRRI